MFARKLGWIHLRELSELEYVKIHNYCQCTPLSIFCGVPQGFSLEPLLFSLYTCDNVRASTHVVVCLGDRMM